MLSIKFHCAPVYDENYLKIEVKACNGVVSEVFSDGKIPKESIH